MANARIGGYAGYDYNYVESFDTTGKQLLRGDSGKVFMCDQNSSADITCFLPQLSTSIAGFKVKFILRSASSYDVFIMAYGGNLDGSASTSGDADSINFFESSDNASSAITADGVYFVASAAVKGDWIEFFTDGTDWYCNAYAEDDAHITAVDSD